MKRSSRNNCGFYTDPGMGHAGSDFSVRVFEINAGLSYLRAIEIIIMFLSVPSCFLHGTVEPMHDLFPVYEHPRPMGLLHSNNSRPMLKLEI